MTNYRQTLSEAYRQVQERELTPKELKRREEIAKDLPIKDFEKRYGKEKGMQVKMATATNMAKKEEIVIDKELEKLSEKFTKIDPKVVDKVKTMLKDPKQKSSLKMIMKHMMPKDVVKMLHKEVPATKQLTENYERNFTNFVLETTDDFGVEYLLVENNIKILQNIVKKKQNAKMKFKDNKKATVDLFTASAIMKVYDAVKPDNKKKMEKLINGTLPEFLKIQAFAMKQVKMR